MLRVCSPSSRLVSLARCQQLKNSCLSRHYATRPPSTPRGSARTLLIGGAVLTLAGTAYLLQPSPSRSSPTLPKAPLSRAHFTPTTVVSRTDVSPTTILLNLQLPPGCWPPARLPTPSDPAPDPAERAEPGSVWSVWMKNSDIMVERPYTPLFGAPGPGGIVTFWIKKYETGEMARWLHARKIGDVVDLRGPVPTWTAPVDKEYTDIVLISGGTGFAPFHQLLTSSLLSPSSPHPTTRFTLLHASPSPAELPPPALLFPLLTYASAHPDRLRVRLFVDTPTPDLPPDALPTAAQPFVRRISVPDVHAALLPGSTPPLTPSNPSWVTRLTSWLSPGSGAPPASPSPRADVFVLVCGPDPMVAALAGPWGRNFSQGAVGGVLGALGYTSAQVRKL